MYLKSLTLRGFKSFARPTTFELEPGITAIVGPNGSGKSNVVDALAWVMGEQGAKSLRGSNMSDIIFAGTAERSQLGRAQVSLTIDNTDGRLPIDYSEVTISRTIFRGGGSEYAINRSPARLLDVQELLSDTGLGRQMHVIVGQGQLDAVLRASAEERRAYIDEAAGVLKHRRRKERALRKLESMDANLVRVVDLTEEIRRQLRPLARQAKAAAKAQDVRDRLEVCELRLAAGDLKQAHERYLADIRALSELRAEVSDVQARVQKRSGVLEETEEQLARYQATQDEYFEIAHELASVAERLRSLVMLTEERLSKYRVSGVTVSEAAIELAHDKAVEAEEELSKAHVELERVRAVSVQAQREREAAELTEMTLQSALQEQNKKVAAQKADQAKLEQNEAVARERLRVCETRLAESDNDVRASEAQVEDARRELGAIDSGSQDQGDELAKNHALTVEDEEKLRALLAEKQSEERERDRELSTWVARRDALGEQLPRVSEESAPDWSIRGYLAQNMVVAPGWENAVAALLWPFDEAVIVDQGADIETGIAAARGRGEDLRAIYGDMSDSAPTLEIVTPNDEVRGALGALLQRCAVASNVARAQEILDDPMSGVDRVATKDGAVLTRAGVRMNIGSRDSLLLLQARWLDACQAAEQAQARLRQAQEAFREVKAMLTRKAAESAEALSRLREWDVQQAEVSGQRASAEAKLKSAEAGLSRNRERNAKAQADLDQATQALEAAQLAIATGSAQVSTSLLEETQRDLTTALAASKLARNTEMDAKVAFSAAEESVRGAQRQANAFKARAAQLVETRAQQSEQEAVNGKIRSQISLQRQQAMEALQRAQKDHEEAKAALALHKATTEAVIERARQCREAIDQINVTNASVIKQCQQAEVAAAASEVRLTQAIEAARRVLHLDNLPEDLESNVELIGPLQDLVAMHGNSYNRDEVQQERDQAASELRKLGVVNPLAMEEYNALKERQAFLTTQVSDLEKSKSDLLSIVRDVDRQIKESFVAAFSETERHFGDVFGKLFPGGTGQLSLTNPDDPLHTGVEISARPAGKRITQMSLLSGGERSLAALAYLIAIFKARPSPFYIMDEVEAALDDVNLSRVLGLFEELRADSQLLLVTHQKRTMEIADALYGVSMRGGTTAVMSHRMTSSPRER